MIGLDEVCRHFGHHNIEFLPVVISTMFAAVVQEIHVVREWYSISLWQIFGVSLQVSLHDLRNLRKELHQFEHHNDEVFQVSQLPIVICDRHTLCKQLMTTH